MEIIQAKRIDLNVITQVGSGRYKRPMPIKEIGLQMEYSKDMYSIGEPISGKGYSTDFFVKLILRCSSVGRARRKRVNFVKSTNKWLLSRLVETKFRGVQDGK
jgi:hypothetical protein